MTRSTAVILIVLIAVATATTDIEETLRCPVCDYSVSYLIRQLAKQQRACQNPETEHSDYETWAARCDASSSSSLHYDYVLQRVLGMCSHDVLESFPAVEAHLPPVEDPADSEAVERRRAVEETTSVKPLETQFHAVVQRVCAQVLPKQQHTRMSKAVFTTVTHILRRYPPESDGAERRDIYGAVLNTQRQFCDKACSGGITNIKRPLSQDGKPTKASFNAFGRRIRYHE